MDTHCEELMVGQEKWQLVTAIHDEGDGLVLCDTQDYDPHFCDVCLVWVELTQWFTLKWYLWIFSAISYILLSARAASDCFPVGNITKSCISACF
jgi:hypothetical protein